MKLCYYPVLVLEIMVLSTVTLVAVSFVFVSFCRHLLKMMFSAKLNNKFLLLPPLLNSCPLFPPSTFFPSPSSLRADEPGDIGVGYLDGLRVGQCTAVPDGRHAHPPPVHPEEQRGIAADCLPVQPQPRRAALHARRPAARPPQRRHADSGGGAALAEVHRVLRHRVW